MNTSERETLPLADAVERVAASVVGVVTRRQRGAAVVWREGVAVTSASSLWRMRGVAIVLPDGEQIDATLRGSDAATDLAVLSFADRGVPALARDGGASVRVGDVVFAVGREPSGAVQASFGHVGAVAGAWRSWRGGDIERLIRLDGGLFPGLAGAAVADASGRLLGVASPMFSRHHGVVLPVATVERVLEQLLAHGRVRQGYLGIAAQPVRAQREGVGVDGLLVSSVAEDGPAARAGLLVGDVIVALAGQPVSSLDALRERLQVGAQTDVEIARGGRAQTLSMQVAERPQARCG